MALPTEALSRLIQILNERDKGGPGGPGKPVTAYKGGTTATPTGRSNAFNYEGGLDAYLQEAQRRGLDISNVKSASELQSRIYDSLMGSKEGQSIIRNMWQNYGDTLKGSGKVLPQNLTEQDLAALRSSFVDDKLGGRTQMVLGGMPQRGGEVPVPQQEQKPERRKVTEIIDKIMAGDASHGVGLVYKNKELEFDPKYGYRLVPGSEYTDVVMYPEESEYMSGEKNQVGLPAINEAAEMYRKKYNARNIVRGKATGEGYDPEYAKQLRMQKIIK